MYGFAIDGSEHAGVRASGQGRLLQACHYGSFRKLGVPYFGVLMTRIPLFRVLYSGPLFSETGDV